MALRNVAFPLALLVVGISGGTALATGAAPKVPPPGPGLDLITERCGFCHTIAQATAVTKTRANWETTVQSMIDRGAELTPEEQKVIVDYLATHMAPPETGAPPPANTPPAPH